MMQHSFPTPTAILTTGDGDGSAAEGGGFRNARRRGRNLKYQTVPASTQELPPLKEYETIDWVADLLKDHARQRSIRTLKMTGNLASWRYTVYENLQSWLLVTLVGVSIGVLVASIDVITAWLTDVRLGMCRTEWYLPSSICCAGYEDKERCVHWGYWSQLSIGFEVSLFNWIFYLAFSVLFAVAAAVFVVEICPSAAGSGTAEVKTILGGFIIRGFLGLKTLLVKSIALPLTVASGLAVGKEGPMIHAACCIGNIFPLLFPKYRNNEARKREILSASAAAGVAVAFGAPIGGVLFSMEELSSFFPAKTMVRSFFCALVSCVTLQFIDPFRGKKVLFAVSSSRDWHFFEVAFFIVLGIFGGLSGAFLSHINVKVRRLRSNHWIKGFPIHETAAIAAFTAAVGFLNPFTRIESSELLEYLFKECDEYDYNGVCKASGRGVTIFLLLFALGFRMILTVISLGLQVPAGIFIPSMVCGALFGRVLGIIVHAWQQSSPHIAFFAACVAEKPCIMPGRYALLGAIGTLAGTTRLTVSLTVVMFELTGTLDYIVPCMVTIMIAKLVGDMFGSGGISDLLIRANGLPFLDLNDEDLCDVPITKIMTPLSGIIMLPKTGPTVRELKEILRVQPFHGFPVVESIDDPVFIGYLSRTDIKEALYSAQDSQIGFGPTTPVVFHLVDEDRASVPLAMLVITLRKTQFTLHPHAHLDLVLDMFKKLGPRCLFVTQMDRLVGLITKKDLLVAVRESAIHSLDSPVVDLKSPVQLM